MSDYSFLRVEVWLDRSGGPIQWSVVAHDPITYELKVIRVEPVEDPFTDPAEAFHQALRFARGIGEQLALFPLT